MEKPYSTRELENFGRFLIRELRIDRPFIDEDWDHFIHKYKCSTLRGKEYGKNHINYTVSRHFDVTAGELFIKDQSARIADPRSISIYMMDICGYSHREIAKYYRMSSGGISKRIKAVNDWYDSNPQMREKIDNIRMKLL